MIGFLRILQKESGIIYLVKGIQRHTFWMVRSFTMYDIQITYRQVTNIGNGYQRFVRKCPVRTILNERVGVSS